MKKNIILLCAFALWTTMLAQTPQTFSYQAILRDAKSALVAESKVSVRISILNGSADGTPVYVETHQLTTNENGLVSLQVGGGTSRQKWEVIDWSAGPFFIKSEADPSGGDTYSIVGVTQILSVPYALYAARAGNSDHWEPDQNGNVSTSVHMGIATPAVDSLALKVGGDVQVAGKLRVDTLHVGFISGLLGTNVLMQIPDVFNNMAQMEIAGINIGEDVLMISGIGIEAERISTPIGVDIDGNTRHVENVGFNMELPLVFEVAEDVAADLQVWFNRANPEVRDLSVFWSDLQGNEVNRVNMYGYVPDGFKQGTEGRLRFTLRSSSPPDNRVGVEVENNLGGEVRFNPETDKLVEVEGIGLGGGSLAAPAVMVDTLKRTVTFTFDYQEGGDAFNWTKEVFTGDDMRRSMSIIETTNGTPQTETSRQNYFECVPIRFDVVKGFGLDRKIQTRLVIAYGWREDA